MCTCSDIWQKVNSPYGFLWKKKKKTQHGDLAQRLKPLNPSRYTDCVRALSLQTHECPSPNSVSIASTQHSL